MKIRRFFYLWIAAVVFSSVAFAADPTGVWKWTAPGRNGQPQETVLKLALAADGTLAGTLTDRSGPVPISNATFRGTDIGFSVIREIPGGKAEVTYVGRINGDKITGTHARPDKSPEAVKAGKKRQADWVAIREPVNPKQ